MSRLAREQHRLQVALTMNKTVQQLEEVVGVPEVASKLEFASMLWDYGQHTAAQRWYDEVWGRE